MLIIGASEIAHYLAEMATTVDYRVFVCDPREEYRQAWRVPGATFVEGMPDDAVAALRPDGHTVVLAVSHDPKLDDMALLEALKSEAFYVGAVGSKQTSAERRKRLAACDLSAARDRAVARPRGACHRLAHAAGDRRGDPRGPHRDPQRPHSRARGRGGHAPHGLIRGLLLAGGAGDALRWREAPCGHGRQRLSHRHPCRSLPLSRAWATRWPSCAPAMRRWRARCARRAATCSRRPIRCAAWGRACRPA